MKYYIVGFYHSRWCGSFFRQFIVCAESEEDAKEQGRKLVEDDSTTIFVDEITLPYELPSND